MCSKESRGIVGTTYKQVCDVQRKALMVVQGEDGLVGVVCRHDENKQRSVLKELDYLEHVSQYRVVVDDGNGDGNGDDISDRPRSRRTRAAATRQSSAVKSSTRKTSVSVWTAK